MASVWQWLFGAVPTQPDRPWAWFRLRAYVDMPDQFPYALEDVLDCFRVARVTLA